MIIVNINPEETYARAAGLWQYDYGQVLRIQGLSLPPAIEIHFSLQETGGEADPRIGITKDGVTDVVIPDFILEGAGAIEDYFAYAFIYPSDENSGQTEHRIEMGVKSRPKPEGYKGSGDDTMGAIMKAVNEIAAGKADGLEYKNSILRLMSGETELARATISGGSGGGADAREIELQKSETAIQWRYVGEEDWKDLVDLADLNGVTPHIGDNGNWYIGETDTGVKAEAPSTDSTLTESGKAADAKITGKKISELKGEIDQLKQAGTGSGSGVTVAQSNSLWAIIQKAAFAEVLTDEELNDFKTSWGITTENIPATGISIDKSTLSFTDSSSQTLIATVDPSNSTDSVTWETSDTGVATVSSGIVSPVSNGSCTITAKAGSVSATCSVTVDIAEEEQVILSSISATYTGGDVTVGTALDDLVGITVTATYSDGSTANVTDYSLSGAIAEGNNTITVSYGGKTTTFTVTGFAKEVDANGPIYKLAQATTFDGTTSIDTGYMLNNEDKDWSVVTEFSASAITSFVWDSSRNSSGGVNIQCPNGYHWRAQVVVNYASIGNGAVANLKVVMTHVKGTETVEVYYIPDNNGTNGEFTSTPVTIKNGVNNSNYKHSNTVRLGSDYTGSSKYFTGTIHRFEIYERILGSDEISAFMGGV